MLRFTLLSCWSSIPTSVSLAVVGLLNAIALLVASKARGTSEDALSISLDQEQLWKQQLGRPVRNESRKAVRARRKSSSRTTTSMSPSRPRTR